MDWSLFGLRIRLASSSITSSASYRVVNTTLENLRLSTTTAKGLFA